MTSRGLVAVALMALVALAASANLAQAGECPGEKPNVTTVTGVVKSLDAESRTLVLTTGEVDPAKDLPLKGCPKAKIIVDGKEATLADVKAGAKARVGYITTDSGGLVAVRIAVGGCGS